MKIKVFSVSIFGLIFPIFCGGQQLPPNFDVPLPKISCEKEWGPFEIKNVSICIPDEIQFEKKKGIDQSFWHFENPEVEISMFSGARSPVLLQERDLCSFKSNTRWIGDIRVEYASFVDDRDLKFTQTARIILTSKPVENSVMIYIKYRGRAYSSIAEMILNSIYVKN